MRFEVYGKQGCNLCKSAHKKLTLFIEKNNIHSQVEIIFIDVDTEEGAAEGDFFDVFEVPTILLVRGDELVKRWERKPPPTEELERLLCQDEGQAAAAA